MRDGDGEPDGLDEPPGEGERDEEAEGEDGDEPGRSPEPEKPQDAEPVPSMKGTPQVCRTFCTAEAVTPAARASALVDRPLRSSS